MKKIVYLFLIILIINACQSSDNTSQKNASDTVKQDENTLPNLEQKPYFGLYSLDSKTMRICGKDSVIYYVEDSANILTEAYTKTLRYRYPDQSAYVQVVGSLKGKNTEGVAAQYTNTLSVSKVNKCEMKSWENNCFGFDFVGFGNKPFWNVDISKKLQLIDFNDIMNEKYYHFNYTVPKVEGDITTFESTDATGKMPIKIVIKKGTCNDGVNEKNYHFSCEVTLNGKVFKGCAQW
jgi:uncharacterized membrane protein